MKNKRKTDTLINTQQRVLLLIVILISTIIFQLGALAYSTSLTEISFQSIFFQNIIYLSIITIPLAGLGIALGFKIGLGTPLLSALLHRQPGALTWLSKDIRLSFLLGFIVGCFLLLLRMFTEPYLPHELPSFGHRGIVGGLLVSAAAAVGEEVWFRLGLMTILLWLVSKVFSHDEIHPPVAWSIITIVSIGFGLAHLPQLLSYGAGSTFAVLGTIIGNSLVGILYGWFYWRRSLIAAIVAHFSVDLVIHVFTAINF